MPKVKKCMNIEYIETDKLVPYINNAKLHPEDQVGKIARTGGIDGVY
jgi:hypothetical protein